MQCAKRYGPDSSHCLYCYGSFVDPLLNTA
jgi:hypothetical protein